MRGDIRDRRAVREAVRGCEEVYHLAANPQLWVKPRRLFREINFVGAANVLEEAVAAGARRVLHTSTESILTRSRQAGPIREDQVVPPGDVIGPYCRSKYRAECHAFELARQGAPIVVVNPTLPVGPGDRGLSPPARMMLDFCKGKRREYLDAELNLIDVRDVALGMVRAMEARQAGPALPAGAREPVDPRGVPHARGADGPAGADAAGALPRRAGGGGGQRDRRRPVDDAARRRRRSLASA